MSKRSRDREVEQRPSKRPKQDKGSQPQARVAVEDIQFARQLQQLLAFQQDGLQQLRHGIASFKAFLDNILYQKDKDNRPRQISILREFLDSQKEKEPAGLDQPFLTQLWQAWSFANENRDDRLASSIGAIFALLLKTLSSLLDLRDYGILLCRTVLQHQHLRLIKRCLEAPKHLEYVISPSLRLLIEVTAFDCGIFANELYKKREQTFDASSVRRNLGMLRTEYVPTLNLSRFTRFHAPFESAQL